MKITKNQIIEWIISFALIATGIVTLICLAVQDVSYTVYVPILMGAIALATGLIISSILDIMTSARNFGEKIKFIKRYNYATSAMIGLCGLLPLIIILGDASKIHHSIYLVAFIIIQEAVVFVLAFCIIQFVKHYKKGIKIDKSQKTKHN